MTHPTAASCGCVIACAQRARTRRALTLACGCGQAMAKAMHNAKVKRPNKVYMVANKAKAGGGKRKSKYGVKMVDRRLKKDKRAAKANGRRSAKK